MRVHFYRHFALLATLMSLSGLIALPGFASADKAGPCALRDCWGDLFSEIRKTAQDVLPIVEEATAAYEASVMRKLEEDSEITGRPYYRLAIYQACLRECESLLEIAREGGTMDLIVIGRHFDSDGNLFDQVAAGYYEERLSARCGNLKGKELARCRKQIVVIREPGRERFFALLGLLKPDSIDSFTYVGHGRKDQIVFGARSLSRPALPHATMTKEQWTAAEDGALYSDDLKEGSRFTRALRRVFRPDSEITFYACDTGQQFAGNFAHAAGVSGAKASVVGMSLRVRRADGRIERASAGAARALRDGERYVLISDRLDGFGEVPAREFAPGLFQRIADHAVEEGRLHVSGFYATLSAEEVGWNTLRRLSAGSAVGSHSFDSDHALFSKKERRIIRGAIEKLESEARKQGGLGRDQKIQDVLTYNAVLEEIKGASPTVSRRLGAVIEEARQKMNRSLLTEWHHRKLRREGFILFDGSLEFRSDLIDNLNNNGL